MTEGTIEVFTENIYDPRISERCDRIYPLLSCEEREKADWFLHREDRLRFITGRLMIRTLAEERLGNAYPEISLTEYGKPYIAGAEGFHFNISHSGSFVVLALSDSPVGVDTEQIVPIEWQDIAETFSPSEREMIDNADDPLRCFYRIWTVREAFSKEEGIGLSLFENEQPEIGYNSGTVNYRGKTLYFNVWEKDGHSVCVCGAYGRILEKTIGENDK